MTWLALGEMKTEMLIYPPDLSKPYNILRCNEDGTYTVFGFAKSIRSNKWIEEMDIDFGGHQSIFIMEKEDFLTKAQKATLRWVKKHLGQRQHDAELERIYDSAIAGHTYINR